MMKLANLQLACLVCSRVALAFARHGAVAECQMGCTYVGLNFSIAARWSVSNVQFTYKTDGIIPTLCEWSTERREEDRTGNMALRTFCIARAHVARAFKRSGEIRPIGALGLRCEKHEAGTRIRRSIAGFGKHTVDVDR
jgi:hypothetical protein